MRELRRNATLPDAKPDTAREEPVETTGVPAGPAGATSDCIVVSHEVLFVETPASRCDACGEHLDGGEAADGYGVPGRGVYLWARGEETRIESVPLCASCASAIGMTALARWEIEEEEG